MSCFRHSPGVATPVKETLIRCFGPLYLALGVGFLTIAVPIKLESYWNTLGWIVEAGALFWAAHRSGRLLLRILGAGAFLLGVGSG